MTQMSFATHEMTDIAIGVINNSDSNGVKHIDCVNLLIYTLYLILIGLSHVAAYQL